jgi:ABC-2 type transport system permease protein
VTAAATLVRTRPARGTEPLAGTARLLRLAVRRDRVRLTFWLLGIVGITVFSAAALDTTYPTAADRQARGELMSNPAAVMLSGPGYGLDNYTLGAIVANEVALMAMLAAAIMSALLTVRHTRADEEDGRTELVGAAAVGRRAPLTAALALVGLADAALALLVTAGLAGSGFAATDSLALGVGIGLTGLVFGAVAAITAQLTAYARAASGAALAVLAAAAVVRGAGDVLRERGSALSWFSPIAWAQQTRAFVDLRWWPLALSAVLVVVLVRTAYGLVGRRDVGAGLVPPRPGPAGASARLSGVVALAGRLQRAAILGWGVALVLLGMVYGSIIDSVTDLLAENQRAAEAVTAIGGGNLADSFVATIGRYLALLVTAFAVSSTLRAYGEEAAGRTGLVLATAVSRRRLLGGTLAVTAGASVLLALGGGLGAGLAAAAVTGDAGQVGRLVGATLAPVPGVLVVAGVAAILVGLVPQRSVLAWTAVAWVVLVGLFGPLLKVPEWVTRLSPFGWVPAVPAESFDPVPLGALTLLAAALFALALAGFRRRDLTA